MNSQLLIISFVFIFLSQNTQAEILNSNLENKSVSTSIEILYNMFSPEFISDDYSVTPQDSGLLGIRFGLSPFSLTIYENFFRDFNTKGFEASFYFRQFLLRYYQAQSKGYKISKVGSTSKNQDLGTNADLKGSNRGLVLMGLLNEENNFALLASGLKTQDAQSSFKEFQYFYDFVYDENKFEDLEEIFSGSGILKQDRKSYLVGLGILMQETEDEYNYASSCSLGLGLTEQEQIDSLSDSDKKQMNVFGINCLLNFNYTNLAKFNESFKNWYMGSQAQILVIQPFENNQMSQRTFLIGLNFGRGF